MRRLLIDLMAIAIAWRLALITPLRCRRRKGGDDDGSGALQPAGNLAQVAKALGRDAIVSGDGKPETAKVLLP